MKIIKQLMIIISVCFAGEVCRSLIPFPIPASVYGLVLMLVLLGTKIVKVEQVEDVSGFFMKIMPLLFISPSVSLIQVAGELRGIVAAFLVTALVSTVAVMVTTGWVAQLLVRMTCKRRTGHMAVEVGDNISDISVEDGGDDNA